VRLSRKVKRKRAPGKEHFSQARLRRRRGECDEGGIVKQKKGTVESISGNRGSHSVCGESKNSSTGKGHKESGPIRVLENREETEGKIALGDLG